MNEKCTQPAEVTGLLEAFDDAVSQELPRVSHVEYDSHEICKHFASKIRAILALRPVQVPMTDADTVQVFGVKDGKETLLGTAPMPARMKARELARENFGNFEDGDGSDAELCFGALEQLIDHIERNAHHGITAKAQKGQG